MLDAKQKALLESAIEKLHEADALMQEALGATEECFDLHCGIESMVEDIAEHTEMLMEHDGQPDEHTEWMDFDPDC